MKSIKLKSQIYETLRDRKNLRKVKLNLTGNEAVLYIIFYILYYKFKCNFNLILLSTEDGR